MTQIPLVPLSFRLKRCGVETSHTSMVQRGGRKFLGSEFPQGPKPLSPIPACLPPRDDAWPVKLSSKSHRKKGCEEMIYIFSQPLFSMPKYLTFENETKGGAASRKRPEGREGLRRSAAFSGETGFQLFSGRAGPVVSASSTNQRGWAFLSSRRRDAPSPSFSNIMKKAEPEPVIRTGWERA